MPLDPTFKKFDLETACAFGAIVIIIIGVADWVELQDLPGSNCTDAIGRVSPSPIPTTSTTSTTTIKTSTTTDSSSTSEKCPSNSALIAAVIGFSILCIIAGALLAMAAISKMYILTLPSAALMVIAVIVYIAETIIIIQVTPERQNHLWSKMELEQQRTMARVSAIISAVLIIVIFVYLCLCAVSLFLRNRQEQSEASKVYMGSNKVDQSPSGGLLPGDEESQPQLNVPGSSFSDPTNKKSVKSVVPSKSSATKRKK